MKRVLLGWVIVVGCAVLFLVSLTVGVANSVFDAGGAVFLLLVFLVLSSPGIVLVVWGKRTKLKEVK